MASSPIRNNDQHWHVTYYSGCGNFFLIAHDPENVHAALSQEERSLLCHRLTPLIVDGLLFLGPENRMHYYNRDGSRASMCGNGLRSISHFAYHLGGRQKRFVIKTDLGPREVSIEQNGLVTTDMGPLPEVTEPLNGWFFTNTGVPHTVRFGTLPEGAIEKMARPIRYNDVFGPQGTNVSFATVDGTVIHLRTYERGVEEETGACGTGACAASVIAEQRFAISFPHSIIFHSGKTAQVSEQHGRIFLTADCEVLGQYTIKNPLQERICTVAVR